MRKTVLFFGAFALAASGILFSSYSGDNTDYPSGAPAGYTGSPYDNKNCTSCHGGTASAVEGWITSDIPGTGYVPGTDYTITVTVTGSGKKGYEVSPQDINGNLLGVLTALGGSHLTGSGKYITHNASTTANPASWSFTWKAPVTGTGDVTFYGAFTVSKSVTKLSTLTVNEYTVGIRDAGAQGPNATISPNPGGGPFLLTLDNYPPGEAYYKVYSLTGSLVASDRLSLDGSNRTAQISLAGQPAGTYLVGITSASTTIVKKIVLTREK